ncbi:MAG: lysophospholipid acyltransferase family protein, partial [Bacteroidota bacterium]
KALKSRIRISNPELFTSFMQNEQSILLMTSHYANWEWMLLGCGAHDLPPIHPIYKPLSNKSMDQMMNRIRSRFGSQPIPKDNTIMSIIQRKKYQEAYGIVGDQAPYHLEEKYWTQFLHQDTAFYEGAEKIARLTKFPVLFAHMQRHKRGYYEITFEVLAEPPYKKMPQNELIEAYVKALEKQILAGPSDWLWTHNRWKYHRGLYE